MKIKIWISWILAALYYCSAPHIGYAEDSSNPGQQIAAYGECYGEAKSAWLVGLGIENKEPVEKTSQFIASLPHSENTKNKLAEGATAMRQGGFPAAEDFGAAQYLSCANAHSLQTLSQNRIAGCLYYLRIMLSFKSSKNKGQSIEEALGVMNKTNPRSTDETRKLIRFLADRTYTTQDFKEEQRMTFDWCLGKM